MTYGSVCSGIEAATVAWEPLGWKAAFYSEIEPFPCAVLRHHYPHVPNYGDMTKFKEWPSAVIDVLVGGTPCQSFSVAGLRTGLADPRGNLMLVFGAIASKYRPKWLVWENVPGVLSSSGGRDFGTFLGMLAELGYGFAYRVLDAQYFGVAQRRRRVFVVGHLGDWRPAAAVLFERESLSGDSAPSREAGQEAARGACFGIDEECNVSKNHYGPLLRGGQGGTRQAVATVCATLDASYGRLQGCSGQDANHGHSHLVSCFQQNTRDEVRYINGDGQIAGALSAEAGAKQQNYMLVHATQDPVASDKTAFALGATSQQAVAFTQNDAARDASVEVAPTQRSGSKGGVVNQCVAFEPGVMSRCGGHIYDEVSGCLRREAGDNQMSVMAGMQVRRLTPVECERLQGFPDNYTRIPWRNKPPEQCPDGPRYKALGNSMAVPVMRWIGERIEHVTPIMEAM